MRPFLLACSGDLLLLPIYRWQLRGVPLLLSRGYLSFGLHLTGLADDFAFLFLSILLLLLLGSLLEVGSAFYFVFLLLGLGWWLVGVL
jgi:hypothetical protein